MYIDRYLGIDLDLNLYLPLIRYWQLRQHIL